MTRPYSGDLRRGFLEALELGEGSEPELSVRFRLGDRYVGKILCRLVRTWKVTRVPYRSGCKSKLTEPICERLLAWRHQQPDFTLFEPQAKHRRRAPLVVSRPCGG